MGADDGVVVGAVVSPRVTWAGADDAAAVVTLGRVDGAEDEALEAGGDESLAMEAAAEVTLGTDAGVSEELVLVTGGVLENGGKGVLDAFQM